MNYFRGNKFPTLKPLTLYQLWEKRVGESKSECDAIGLLFFFPCDFSSNKIRIMQNLLRIECVLLFMYIFVRNILLSNKCLVNDIWNEYRNACRYSRVVSFIVVRLLQNLNRPTNCTSHPQRQDSNHIQRFRS